MSRARHNNKEKRPRPAGRRKGLAPASGTSDAKRCAAAILEVLAGVRRPSEAAATLGTSLPRYYQLERRALTGLLQACEPVARGPRVNLSRQLTALERENQRLQRECQRQQALVRMAQRAFGLSPPSAVKASSKAHQEPQNGGTKQRRQRKASVRALQVARGLCSDATADLSTNGVTQAETEVAS